MDALRQRRASDVGNQRMREVTRLTSQGGIRRRGVGLSLRGDGIGRMLRAHHRPRTPGRARKETDDRRSGRNTQIAGHKGWPRIGHRRTTQDSEACLLYTSRCV